MNDVSSLYPDSRILFDQAPVGYLVTDEEDRVLLANRTLLDWLGYTLEQLRGRIWSEVLLSRVGRAFLETHAQPLLQVRHAVHELFVDLVCADHGRLSVLMSAVLETRPAHSVDKLTRYTFIKALDRLHYEQQLLAAKHEAEDASEQLRELAADLEKRVSERTAELTAANRDLDSFTYTVSHDLRAPLRVVSGYCDLLTVDAGSTLGQASSEYLQRIRQAVQSMNAMIDAVLQLSTGARAEIEYAQIDLTAMAVRICAELQLTHPGQAVEYRVQPGMSIAGDPRLMDIVLRNLIGNAWKYSGHVSRPVVDITSVDEGHERIFVVRDNGIGFDMASAAQLFQPFKRLPSGQTFSGVGIGLSTVKRIVERHHGRIYASSMPGQGASFCFALPIFPQRSA